MVAGLGLSTRDGDPPEGGSRGEPMKWVKNQKLRDEVDLCDYHGMGLSSVGKRNL